MRTAVTAMLALFALGAAAQGPTELTPPADERLNIATLNIRGELDNHFGEEIGRLSRFCSMRPSGCSPQDVEPTRRRVAVLHSEPSASSRVVGAVHGVVTSPYADQTLTVALDVEVAERPGVFLNWKKHEDGYSYHAYGVRVRGDWIQLVGAPFPASAWLNLQGSPLEGSVDPIAKNILHLTNLPATGANGRRAQVKRVPYFILRVSPSEVAFREEVESDMPCEGPVKPPAVMPPTLRAPPGAFFDSKGQPRFELVYTKGC